MALPDKDFYSLTEIAARWNCDDATFLSYASQDILTFSVYLKELGSYRTVEEIGDEIHTREHSIVFSMRSPDYKHYSLRYLLGDDARRILESQPPEQVAISVLYRSPQRIKKHGTGYPQAKYFTKTDLLVSREERDRFEQTHKILTKPSWSKRAWLWLKEAENQKPLLIIGGGIATLAGAAWTALQWFMKVTPQP